MKSFGGGHTQGASAGDISDMIQSPRGAIGSYSGMIAGNQASGQQQSNQGRFQNLNIMSRRKSNNTIGG